jgi:DNA-binding NarL/FixJ family response regulator
MGQTTVAIIDCSPVVTDELSERLAREPDLRVVARISADPTTFDPEQVAAVVAEHHPDVLVLDAHLAYRDTQSVLQGTMTGNQRPSVVLLTSCDEPEGEERALQAGASAVVLKIAPTDELLEAVRSAANGTPWFSPPLVPSLLARYRRQSVQAFARSRLDRLSMRERQVLALLAEGLDIPEIAGHLGVSLRTVQNHTRNLQKKLELRSLADARSMALETGLQLER